MAEVKSRDVAADIIRSVFERIVIETPEGPMVFREVRSDEEQELILWIEPDEPVIGTLHFGEDNNRDAEMPKGWEAFMDRG